MSRSGFWSLSQAGDRSYPHVDLGVAGPCPRASSPDRHEDSPGATTAPDTTTHCSPPGDEWGGGTAATGRAVLGALWRFPGKAVLAAALGSLLFLSPSLRPFAAVAEPSRVLSNESPLAVATDVDWSKESMARTVEALRTMGSTLAGGRIICSGENDHGVAEAFQVHAALARYLVHDHGVRHIALEWEATHVRPLERFLASGDRAELDAALGGEGRYINVEEWERLLVALRAIQEELPAGERIHLTGFDVSGGSTSPELSDLRSYLERVEPSEVQEWLERLGSGNEISAAIAAQALTDLLEANKARHVQATSESEWKRSRQTTLNLRDGRRFAFLWKHGKFARGNSLYREPGMIRNVEALAAAATTPIMLIAHNAHCGRRLQAGQNLDHEKDSPALGSHLATSHGRAFVTVAQLYLQGEHRTDWYGLERISAFNHGEQSFEGVLDRLVPEGGNAVVSTTAFPEAGKKWDLLKSYYQGSLIPAEQFDLIVLMRKVHAPTPRHR